MTDEELPTQDDFDPWHGNLDAIWAHGLFGGLTIPQAIQKYRERPCIYQEAFMCMGGKAFAYYFPVLEHFVYSLPIYNIADDDYDADRNDPCGWILAYCIKCQFDAPDNHYVKHLAGRVIDLAQFVQENLNRFEPDLYGNNEESVSYAWAVLTQTVQSCQYPPPSTRI